MKDLLRSEGNFVCGFLRQFFGSFRLVRVCIRRERTQQAIDIQGTVVQWVCVDSTEIPPFREDLLKRSAGQARTGQEAVLILH